MSSDDEDELMPNSGEPRHRLAEDSDDEGAGALGAAISKRWRKIHDEEDEEIEQQSESNHSRSSQMARALQGIDAKSVSDLANVRPRGSFAGHNWQLNRIDDDNSSSNDSERSSRQDDPTGGGGGDSELGEGGSVSRLCPGEHMLRLPPFNRGPGGAWFSAAAAKVTTHGTTGRVQGLSVANAVCVNVPLTMFNETPRMFADMRVERDDMCVDGTAEPQRARACAVARILGLLVGHTDGRMGNGSHIDKKTANDGDAQGGLPFGQGGIGDQHSDADEDAGPSSSSKTKKPLLSYNMQDPSVKDSAAAVPMFCYALEYVMGNSAHGTGDLVTNVRLWKLTMDPAHSDAKGFAHMIKETREERARVAHGKRSAELSAKECANRWHGNSGHVWRQWRQVDSNMALFEQYRLYANTTENTTKLGCMYAWPRSKLELSMMQKAGDHLLAPERLLNPWSQSLWLGIDTGDEHPNMKNLRLVFGDDDRFGVLAQEEAARDNELINPLKAGIDKIGSSENAAKLQLEPDKYQARDPDTNTSYNVFCVDRRIAGNDDVAASDCKFWVLDPSFDPLITEWPPMPRSATSPPKEVLLIFKEVLVQRGEGNWAAGLSWDSPALQVRFETHLRGEQALDMHTSAMERRNVVVNREKVAPTGTTAVAPGQADGPQRGTPVSPMTTLRKALQNCVDMLHEWRTYQYNQMEDHYRSGGAASGSGTVNFGTDATNEAERVRKEWQVKEIQFENAMRAYRTMAIARAEVLLQTQTSQLPPGLVHRIKEGAKLIGRSRGGSALFDTELCDARLSAFGHLCNEDHYWATEVCGMEGRDCAHIFPTMLYHTFEACLLQPKSLFLLYGEGASGKSMWLTRVLPMTVPKGMIIDGGSESANAGNNGENPVDMFLEVFDESTNWLRGDTSGKNPAATDKQEKYKERITKGRSSHKRTVRKSMPDGSETLVDDIIVTNAGQAMFMCANLGPNLGGEGKGSAQDPMASRVKGLHVRKAPRRRKIRDPNPMRLPEHKEKQQNMLVLDYLTTRACFLYNTVPGFQPPLGYARELWLRLDQALFEQFEIPLPEDRDRERREAMLTTVKMRAACFETFGVTQYHNLYNEKPLEEGAKRPVFQPSDMHRIHKHLNPDKEQILYVFCLELKQRNVSLTDALAIALAETLGLDRSAPGRAFTSLTQDRDYLARTDADGKGSSSHDTAHAEPRLKAREERLRRRRETLVPAATGLQPDDIDPEWSEVCIFYAPHEVLSKCKKAASSSVGVTDDEGDAAPRVRFLRRAAEASDEGGMAADGTVWDLKWMISPELRGSFRSVAEVICNRDYLMFRACVGQAVASDGLRTISTHERVKQKQGTGLVKAPPSSEGSGSGGNTNINDWDNEPDENGSVPTKRRRTAEAVAKITDFMQTSPDEQKSNYQKALKNPNMFGAARLMSSDSDDLVEQPALSFKFDASASAMGSDPTVSRHLAINTEWMRRKIEACEGEARLYMRNYPGMYIKCEGSGTTQPYCINEMREIQSDGLPRSYDCAEMYRVIWCAKLIIWGSGIMDSSPEFVLPFSRLDEQSALMTIDLRRKEPAGLSAEMERRKKKQTSFATSGTTPYMYSLAFGKRADTDTMRSYNDETTGQAYYRDRDEKGNPIDPFNGALFTWATREGLVRTSGVFGVAHESQTSYALDDFEAAQEAQAAEAAKCGSLFDKVPIVNKRILQNATLSMGNDAESSSEFMRSRVKAKDFPIDRLSYTDATTMKSYLDGPQPRKAHGKQPMREDIGQPIGREYV